MFVGVADDMPRVKTHRSCRGGSTVSTGGSVDNADVAKGVPNAVSVLASGRSAMAELQSDQLKLERNSALFKQLSGKKKKKKAETRPPARPK